jgi:hypothetical protein
MPHYITLFRFTQKGVENITDIDWPTDRQSTCVESATSRSPLLSW